MKKVELLTENLEDGGWKEWVVFLEEESCSHDDQWYGSNGEHTFSQIEMKKAYYELYSSTGDLLNRTHVSPSIARMLHKHEIQTVIDNWDSY